MSSLRKLKESAAGLLRSFSGSNLRSKLYKFYDAAQDALAPGLRNSQYAHKEALNSWVMTGIRWLDLGCGHQLLPEWMPSAKEEQAALVRRPKMVVGIDADIASLRKNIVFRHRVLGDIGHLPFANGTFDLVTANMVVEHVQDPRAMLTEVRRVLKPNGIFLFHTPNLWGYTTLVACLLPRSLKLRLIRFLQAMKEEDVFPASYRINTAGRVHELAQEHGFSVLVLNLIESSTQTVMLGPVVIAELLLIRALRLRPLQKLRTNIIAALHKPTCNAGISVFAQGRR